MSSKKEMSHFLFLTKKNGSKNMHLSIIHLIQQWPGGSRLVRTGRPPCRYCSHSTEDADGSLNKKTRQQ